MNTNNSKITRSSVRRLDVLHLDFGLRAGNGIDKRPFLEWAGRHASMPFPSMNHFLSFMSKYGIHFIGHEEVDADAQGLAPSIWNVHDPHGAGSAGIDFVTSGTINVLNQSGSSEEGELARNIAFSVRAMAYRLRDVSNSYADQLYYGLMAGTQAGKRFSNLDTLKVFLNIHSFLVEAGTLRDHLAALLAVKVFAKPKLTKMSQILDFLRKEQRAEPIAAELLAISDRSAPTGWLARLSNLRNLVVHSAPITSFQKMHALTMDFEKIGDEQVPVVRFLVPIDPILAPTGLKIDVLHQCTEIARNMFDLTRGVIMASGIKPELRKITSADMR